HGLTTVLVSAVSFYSAPVNGIIRGEVEYFLDEPAFIPSENIPFERLPRQAALRKFLALGGVRLPGGPIAGSVPRAAFLRWELGYDRFFFFRPLNRTNSFRLVTALVGSWNLSETFTEEDFRCYGQRKPSDTGLKTGANVNQLKAITDLPKLHTVDTDFVDLKPVESFVQSTLQTDYLHGRLTPRVTAIINLRGTYAFPLGLTYRYSDSLIFALKYIILAGGFFQPGSRSRLGAEASPRSLGRARRLGRSPFRPPRSRAARRAKPVAAVPARGVSGVQGGKGRRRRGPGASRRPARPAGPTRLTPCDRL